MRTVVSCLMVLLSICGAARAQNGSGSQRLQGGAIIPREETSRDFKYVLKQRDEEVSRWTEVRRITVFANAASVRIRRLFDAVERSGTGLNPKQRLEAELSRLEQFEASYAAAPEGRADLKAMQIALFNRHFPVQLDDAVAGQKGVAGGANGQEADSNYTNLIKDLTLLHTELKQNLSPGHHRWPARFEELLTKWSAELRGAAGMAAANVLRRLPGAFYELGGVGEFQPMSDEQVRVACNNYRTTLQAAIEAIKTAPTLAAIRTSMLAEADGFRSKIGDILEDYDNKSDENLNSIVGTAVNAFGSNVNSNIFGILMGVFGVVFLLIMVGPRIYSGSIAENLLKSEFLLQISTVFVLISAIIVLGVAGLIESDQLPVLLAGISGYVLGQLGKPGVGSEVARTVARTAEGVGPQERRHPLTDQPMQPPANDQAGGGRPQTG